MYRLSFAGTNEQSVDSLAFDMLTPKSIVQRYVSLLLEHCRIILCGSSGTGKTYLARKLAEHVVVRYVIVSLVILNVYLGGFIVSLSGLRL
jgi:ATP-dependent protease Clp ATPase subunit